MCAHVTSLSKVIKVEESLLDVFFLIAECDVPSRSALCDQRQKLEKFLISVIIVSVNVRDDSTFSIYSPSRVFDAKWAFSD